MMNDTNEVEPRIPQVSNLPSWPIWAPFAAIGLGLLTSLISDVTLRVLFRKLMPQPGLLHDLSLILSLLAGLSGVLILGFILKGGLSAARLGLTRTSLKVAVGLGILAYVIEIVVQLLVPLFIEFEPPDISYISKLGVITAYVTIAIIGPVAEEILFRGVLFSAFSRRFGLTVGVIVSASLFGLAHLSNNGLLEISLLAFSGVVLALLYWLTGSIIPGIVLHGFGNALVVGEALHYGFWTIPIAVAVVLILLLLTLPFAKVRFAPNWPRFLAKP